jgi:NAD(P)-dependent dehydrogenase (short-subunit alcohol dehydrogenase family)
LETADLGIRAYNVQPGFITTERMIQDMGDFGFDASSGAPPALIGKVCVWLLESPDAAALNGQNIEAQELADELNLLPGWSLTPAG